MPIPSIPSSSSSCPQYLSKSTRGGSHAYTELLPPCSSRSPSNSCSVRPADNKLSRVGRMSRSGGGKKMNSDHNQLTAAAAEETTQLEAHRIIQFALAQENRYKYNNKDYHSPYYQGLTDSSLIISRTSSPHDQNTEIHHATAISSISWISLSSSFIVKVMQEMSLSCFHFKTKRDHHHHHHHHHHQHQHNKNKKPPRPATPSSSSLWSTSLSSKSTKPADSSTKTTTTTTTTIRTTLGKELKMERKKESKLNIEEDTELVTTKEKPLRESLTASVEAVVVPTTPLSSSSSSSSSSSTPEEEDKEKANQKEEMMNTVEENFTWAKKYQPKVLDDFICNRDKAIQLLTRTKEGGCGHFIFEGPPGVGKRTMIWAMLREAFGPETILDCREECKAFNLKGEVVGKIEVNVKESPQHVEVNLSELKGYEKHVILELIKDNPNWIADKALPCSLDNCRAIILYEADKLSTDALLYIKWLLERYKGCNKVFFCCSDVSKLQPIKSLCTFVSLLPPSRNEIVEVLEFIAKQEGIELQNNLAEKIADNSKNNLRQAIRSFEATWLKSYPFAEDQVVLTGWEDDIANIAKNVVKEQSPKQLYTIRGKLQNLIEHGVSSDFIFKSLVEELKKHLDEQLKQRLDLLYAEYLKKEENMFESDKAGPAQNRRDLNDPTRKNIQKFLTIEEFIAKFMSCYKGAVKNMQRDSAT